MPNQLLDQVETSHRAVAPEISRGRKSALGQFMTPAPIASFMASLFPPSAVRTCVLLDAGAGLGSLSSAFLDRWTAADGFSFQNAEIDAYEIDDMLRSHLEERLSTYAERLPLVKRVFSEDFIEAAALRSMGPRRFTHAILNPPYKKVNSLSKHRSILRQVGIETVNLYTAFVALSLSLIRSGHRPEKTQNMMLHVG